MTDFPYKYVMGELSVTEYWSHIMGVISFPGCRDLKRWEEKLKKVLNEVFWEMDQLDRSDPFWEHTNKLPTFHKIEGFTSYMLRTRRDARYAWAIIAISLMTGNCHLIAPLWKILQEHNEIDMEFLVNTAWDIAPNSSSDGMTVFVEFFNNFIRELDLQDKILPHLSALVDLNEDASDWACALQKRMEL